MRLQSLQEPEAAAIHGGRRSSPPEISVNCPRRLLVMPEKKFRVLILGHGEMGQAMEFLLAAHQPLRIWQRRPPAGETPVNLAAVVPESDVILFCLPATAHAAVVARIAPPPRGDTPRP